MLPVPLRGPVGTGAADPQSSVQLTPANPAEPAMILCLNGSSAKRAEFLRRRAAFDFGVLRKTCRMAGAGAATRDFDFGGNDLVGVIVALEIYYGECVRQ